MIPERISNHTEIALSRLVEQFKKSKPVLHGLIRAYVDELQDLENAIWDVIDYRLLDPAPGRSHGAEGAQLDVLGKIVGAARLGLDDPRFREAIRLQIRVNRSHGRTADLLEIVRLAIPLPGSFEYAEELHYTFRVYAPSVPDDLAFVLLSALNRARAAGYRAILEYHTDSISTSALFRWADDNGGSPTGGAGGFGNDGDPSSGGLLTSIQG